MLHKEPGINSKISDHQQSWPRPLPGAFLIPLLCWWSLISPDFIQYRSSLKADFIAVPRPQNGFEYQAKAIIGHWA